MTLHLFRSGLICPPNYNIAEFLINNVSLSDHGANERIDRLCQQYSSSSMRSELEELIKTTCFLDGIMVESSLGEKKNKVTIFSNGCASISARI